MATSKGKDAAAEPNEDVINEDLYSRQIYVLGATGQRKLQQAKVLVSGELSGLGAELCKNVTLAGVNSICLHDDTSCQITDLSSAGFVMGDAHVAQHIPRSTALSAELRELNTNVNVSQISGEAEYAAFDVVVLVNCTRTKILSVSSALRTISPQNQRCKTRLVVTGMYGLFAYAFSDFGCSWEVSDPDGEVLKSGLVLKAQMVPGSDELEVTTELPHRLSEGDWVRINIGHEPYQRTNNPFAEPRKVDLVYTPQGGSKVEECKFRIQFSEQAKGWPSKTSVSMLESSYFEQVKLPTTVSTHAPFEASLEAPSFVANSFEDETRPQRLFALLMAIWAFQEMNDGRLPSVGNQTEVDAVLADVSRRCSSLTRQQREELALLVSTAAGKLSPIASFIGGVAGQEVLKACTGKFMPIDQWLFFSAPECLHAMTQTTRVGQQGKGTRYDGQIAVFGSDAQKTLGSLKVFVVGAGALGCEILKILALSGVSTSSQGGVTYVTDPDSIEMSNLSRQFLFRPQSVGKNKARVAAEACRKMNPEFNVMPFEERVCADTATTVFTDSFWDSLDVVINALDNVPSRLYVDSQCVYYSKPLLESGTLGTKANTLPVIPQLTESYGSDPVKDFESTTEIPACTLHAYPNLFEHTLQWARDAVFEKEFSLEPLEAKEFLDAYNRDGRAETYITTLLRQPNSMSQKIRTARAVLSGIVPSDHGEGLFPYEIRTHRPVDSSSNAKQPMTFANCVHLARLKFEELFRNKIALLLHQHPPHSKDGDVPFWTGKRRQPTATLFDEADHMHLLFVLSAARLYAEVHQVTVPSGINLDEIANMLRTVCPSVPVSFRPSAGPSPNSSTETSAASGGMWKADVDLMESVLKHSPDVRIEPVRFEKDNDVHIDLVWTAALIRARNYKIPSVDRIESKRVVGRIIPAIATATAAACGLVTLELYKYAFSAPSSRKVEHFRACNFNLAVNSYASFEPRPCSKKQTFGRMDCNLWSVITLKGDLTVDELISTFERTFTGFQVSSISTLGDLTLYNDLFSMDDHDKLTSISDLYRKVVGKEPPEVFIPLTVDGDFDDDAMDDQDNDSPLVPPVRLRWKDNSDSE